MVSLNLSGRYHAGRLVNRASLMSIHNPKTKKQDKSKNPNVCGIKSATQAMRDGTTLQTNMACRFLIARFSRFIAKAQWRAPRKLKITTA